MGPWTHLRTRCSSTWHRASWTPATCRWCWLRCAVGTGPGLAGLALPSQWHVRVRCPMNSVPAWLAAWQATHPQPRSAGGAAAASAKPQGQQQPLAPTRCSACAAPRPVWVHRTNSVGMGRGQAARGCSGPRPFPAEGRASCRVAGVHEVQQAVLERRRSAIADMQRVQVPNRHQKNRWGFPLERDEFSWNQEDRNARSSLGEWQRIPIPRKLIPL